MYAVICLALILAAPGRTEPSCGRKQGLKTENTRTALRKEHLCVNSYCRMFSFWIFSVSISVTALFLQRRSASRQE
ncbi:hypothetical protein ACQKWADRAFT_306724 [Trichoderma austrokoningii]